MKITEDTIDHIAHLARLKFEGKEKVAIQHDMENILGFMETLNEIPTENVAPLIFMSDEVNRLREDVPELTISQQEVLKNAPKKDSDYFRIPKVLEK